MVKENKINLIRQEMEHQNLTPTEVADEIGIARTTLIRNLSGKTEMSLLTYIKICQYLG